MRFFTVIKIFFFLSFYFFSLDLSSSFSAKIPSSFVLEKLDQINLLQNQTRKKISSLSLSEKELTMSLENLSLEIKKQTDELKKQTKKLKTLFEIAYKIEKRGFLLFLLMEGDLGSIFYRTRVLYQSLLMHSSLSKEIIERRVRLKKTEQALEEAKFGLKQILPELMHQEHTLSQLLRKKKELLREERKRKGDESFSIVHSRMIGEIKKLFFSLDQSNTAIEKKNKKEGLRWLISLRGKLSFPVEGGEVLQEYGKRIHEKFHTVTFYRGIEIGADANAPVLAPLSGKVEFAGWVKGLGNVVILHHEKNLYSLSGHLSTILTSVNSFVKQTEPIGLLGDTGINEKPSLYFELRQNNQPIDPMLFFPSRFSSQDASYISDES